MTIQTLVSALTTAKFDVHLGKAPDGTACPYAVLKEITQPNFAADNKTFTETTSLRIVLVEDEVHNWTLISTLKSELDKLGLTYSVTFVDEPSEHVCESYYDLRFLGGIENG